MAIAAAGAVIGINPFDQPDVEASKIKTRELTEAYEKRQAARRAAGSARTAGCGLFADPANVAALCPARGARRLELWLAGSFRPRRRRRLHRPARLSRPDARPNIHRAAGRAQTPARPPQGGDGPGVRAEVPPLHRPGLQGRSQQRRSSSRSPPRRGATWRSPAARRPSAWSRPPRRWATSRCWPNAGAACCASISARTWMKVSQGSWTRRCGPCDGRALEGRALLNGALVIPDGARSGPIRDGTPNFRPPPDGAQRRAGGMVQSTPSWAPEPQCTRPDTSPGSAYGPSGRILEFDVSSAALRRFAASAGMTNSLSGKIEIRHAARRDRNGPHGGEYRPPADQGGSPVRDLGSGARRSTTWPRTARPAQRTSPIWSPSPEGPRAVWIMLPAGEIDRGDGHQGRPEPVKRRHDHRRRQHLLSRRYPPRRKPWPRRASPMSTSAPRAASGAWSAAIA